ncbi:MAG: hypothetical protein Q8O29_07130 [Polaromonas sp.]|uniref:hypothetical protein n=1 Tax=Polaromonas sp. TaxID=1869339 RepID=UPI002736FA67|nr:hypothetical protein [Polaromonas sp.]MDP2818045.1 hypothetical protein [Polaromonas sp.]
MTILRSGTEARPAIRRSEAVFGKREDFEQFLKLVPDAPALAGDELPSDADALVKTRNKKA